MCDAESFQCKTRSNCKRAKCGRDIFGKITVLKDNVQTEINVCKYHNKLASQKYNIKDFDLTLKIRKEVINENYNMYLYTKQHYDDMLRTLSNLKNILISALAELETTLNILDGKIEKTSEELKSKAANKTDLQKKIDALATTAKGNASNQPEIDKLNLQITNLNNEIDQLENNLKDDKVKRDDIEFKASTCNQNIFFTERKQLEALERGKQILAQYDQGKVVPEKEVILA